jgi:NADPH-dependent 2,4-dienoyl-CoA reductase/sulfur reductase-like enzyme
MQPRRAQILDLLDWYEGQLEAHRVDLRLNTPMEAAEVAAFGADVIVIATGSQPDRSGFQRFGPTPGRIDGMHNANVWPVEDVMSRACRPGKRILLLDDGGNWRGCGTAWYLAGHDHTVTLLTPDGLVGKELVRSAADFPLRSALKRLGVTFITDAAIKKWHGDGATIVNLLDASEWREPYDALILATPNVADTALFDALADSAPALHSVGDCVAPRWAVHAIYEGRKLGLSL